MIGILLVSGCASRCQCVPVQPPDSMRSNYRPEVKVPIVATPARVRNLPDPSVIACQRRPESLLIDGLSLNQDASSVYVAQITRGLVADALRNSGLRTGDRIYKIDGCDVRSGRDVAAQLRAVAPGFGAVIRVFRGEWLSLTFKKP